MDIADTSLSVCDCRCHLRVQQPSCLPLSGKQTQLLTRPSIKRAKQLSVDRIEKRLHVLCCGKSLVEWPRVRIHGGKASSS